MSLIFPRLRLPLLVVGLLIGLGTRAASAQSDGVLQLDDELHVYLESRRTLGHLPNTHLAHKPLSAYVAREALEKLDHLPTRDSIPEIGPLYGNGRDLWSVEGDGFAIQLNPLLYLSVGHSSRWLNFGRPGGSLESRTTWRNTRGIRASGHIGPHLFFEARIEETQERPALTEFKPRTAARLGSVRPYARATGYDYQIATGILGIRSDHFEIRFGRDRNHWGYGEGSLVLSDYAPAYDHLQIRTSIWRLQYVNLFAGFANNDPWLFRAPDHMIPMKYGAFHRLSVNVTDRINLNVFESVIFGADSTSQRSEGFDIAYLNPVIFYRPVESDRGSPDNVLIGFGGSWIVLDGLQLYGQMLLDEFVIRELFTSSWRNKTGYLAGIHVVPSSDLSLRAEFARLRPFVYTHRTRTTAYMHFLDGLGHPAGPNSMDAAIFLNWLPRSRWKGRVHVAYTTLGRSTREQNVGSDLRYGYDTRSRDWVGTLDGIPQNRILGEASAGYELLPRLMLEVGARGERIDDEVQGVTAYIEPFATLRWGMPFASVRY